MTRIAEHLARGRGAAPTRSSSEREDAATKASRERRRRGGSSQVSSGASLVILLACHPAAPVATSCPADLLLAGQDDIARFAGCTAARSVTIRTAAPLDTTPLAL